MLTYNCAVGTLIILLSYGGMWFTVATTKNVGEAKLSWCHFLMGAWAGVVFAFAHGFGLGLGSLAQTGRPLELSWTTYAVCSCLYSTANILGARQGLRSGLDKPKPKLRWNDWDNEIV